MSLTIHYFGVKARGFSSIVAAAYFGRDLHWEKYTKLDWEKNKNDIKSKCTFDQLPILVDGDIIVAQSNGILRYLCRKWFKDGSDNLKDFGKTNVLIEEASDMYDMFRNTRYRDGNTYDAWKKTLTDLQKHYNNLEKLMIDVQFTTRILMGDMALFASINMAMDLDKKTLDKHAQLKKWYNNILKNSEVEKLLKTSDSYYKHTKKRTKIALVGSNVSDLKDGEEVKAKTGSWSEEITTPYYVFIDGGYNVDLYSVKGGKIIIDETSLTPDNKKKSDDCFLADAEAMNKIDNSLPLNTLKVEDYDMIFFAGGHGPLVDYLEDDVKNVVETFWNEGKVIAAVCHGSICFANASFLPGKNITSFSMEEDKIVGMYCPVICETILTERGARHCKGPSWMPYVIQHEGLITGQNPASSKKCAEDALALTNKWRSHVSVRSLQTKTTPSSPINKKRKKDKKDTTLRDLSAVKFWDKHWPGLDIVSNSEFSKPLEKYLKKHIKDDDERSFFVDEVVKKFLPVIYPKKYPDKKPIKDYIDRDGIQYVINIFGPWIKLFPFISENFFHSEFSPRPLDFFHGKLTKKKTEQMLKKKNEKRSAMKKRYLLRYGPGYLQISFLMRSSNKKNIYRDEKINRKAPRTVEHSDGSKTKNSATWIFSQRVASIGSYQIVKKEFQTLSDIFDFLKSRHILTKNKKPKIKTPVLIAGYIVDPARNVSSDPEEEEEITVKTVDDEDSTDEDYVDADMKLEQENIEESTHKWIHSETYASTSSSSTTTTRISTTTTTTTS